MSLKLVNRGCRLARVQATAAPSLGSGAASRRGGAGLRVLLRRRSLLRSPPRGRR